MLKSSDVHPETEILDPRPKLLRFHMPDLVILLYTGETGDKGVRSSTVPVTGEVWLVRKVVWWSGPVLGSYHLEGVIWFLFDRINLP
jgi:hypothetical protein